MDWRQIKQEDIISIRFAYNPPATAIFWKFKHKLHKEPSPFDCPYCEIREMKILNKRIKDLGKSL